MTWAIDLRELPHQERTVIEASGPDALRFLQGLLSADLETCSESKAIPATLLTVKGKILADLIVWRPAPDRFWLAVPAGERDEVAAKLDRHLIMDEVELRSIAADQCRCALAWGEAPTVASIEILETSVPVRGWLLVGEEAALESALSSLERGTERGWTDRRVADATPAWGYEIAPEWFPPEVGHVAAVSYDKGCFLGQEPLSRIHSRGRVNRVLVRVHKVGDAWPSADPLRAEGRDDAGRLTTRGDSEGLAVVHRSVAEPGVELEGEGARVRVASGPQGDDQGVGQGRAVTVSLGGR